MVQPETWFESARKNAEKIGSETEVLARQGASPDSTASENDRRRLNCLLFS